jgi:hypothetical protein
MHRILTKATVKKHWRKVICIIAPIIAVLLSAESCSGGDSGTKADTKSQKTSSSLPHRRMS